MQAAEKRRESQRRYYAANRDRIKAQQSEYRARSKDKKSEYMRNYCAENAESIREYQRKYREENRDKLNAQMRRHYAENKDRWREYQAENRAEISRARREWSKNNKDKVINQSKTRRARKHNALAAWRNQFFIDEIYELARLRTEMTGIEWHVDHIIPLKNDLICGLHVENNLQVIPARDNLRKGNSFAILKS